MELLIASDIFGKTPELDGMVSQLSTHADHTTIVDPYGGKYLNFKDEDEAYHYFQDTVGLERYKEIVCTTAAEIKQDLLLVGFSVGASAIWAISDTLDTHTHSISAIGFYGSQIRNFMDVSAKIPMDLIFPEHEAHFDVENLMAKISGKNNVQCRSTSDLHGFMNQRSVNFSGSAFEYYVNYIKEKLTSYSAL